MDLSVRVTLQRPVVLDRLLVFHEKVVDLLRVRLLDLPVRIRFHRNPFNHLFLGFDRTLLLARILSFQAGAVVDIVLELFD